MGAWGLMHCSSDFKVQCSRDSRDSIVHLSRDSKDCSRDSKDCSRDAFNRTQPGIQGSTGQKAQQ